MLSTPCFLVSMVGGRKRKDWRELESIGDAARRLLAKMDERKQHTATKASERLTQGSDKSQAFPALSLAWENADGASARGSGALKRRPQSTPVREDTGDHAAERGGNSSGLGGWRGCAFCGFPISAPPPPRGRSDGAGGQGRGFAVGGREE